MYKRFHKSDSLIYQYDLMNVHDKRVIRSVVTLTASENVTWRDIYEEFQALYSTSNPKSEPMRTCTTDTEHFIVSLTFAGFINAMVELDKRGNKNTDLDVKFREQAETVAKELVTQRDYNNYLKWTMNEGNRFLAKKWSDFYPQD